jgi:CIC family chloride channel protein
MGALDMTVESPQSFGARMRQRWAAASDHALRAFLRLVPTEQQRLFVLTLVIGAVCGLVAVAFHGMIRLAEQLFIDRAMAMPGHSWIGWTLAVPTLGALVAGVLLHYGLPEARGSSIPQVKFIYAVKSGRVRLRDAVGKFGISVLQIGTGSALGREGPTVQICAGVASALGRLFAISPRNMRRLIPVGSAAGIAAAFNAPIAAVTFTIEEIVGGLDQTLLSGIVVAAALAAVIERGVLGGHPVFDVPGHYGLTHASSLVIYAAVGVAAAFVADLFCAALLSTRARTRALRAPPPWARPALGGLATGVLAVVVMLTLGARGVTGDGYATLSSALSGQLGLEVMVVLGAAKLVATALCFGTGGAGGIFAPVLFIGGMIGGTFGQLDRILLSHGDSDLGAFALVGMGAFFAAVIRAPITSVLIIFEMTGSYGLILPLMIANSAAFLLARRLRQVPIYEALLDQDGMHLPDTQRTATALSALSVGDAMTTDMIVLPPELRVVQAVERIKGLPYTMYPVAGADGQVLGIVTESRLRRQLASGQGETPVSDHARTEEYLRAGTPLVDAVVRMNQLRARQMAVVDQDQAACVVGVLAMSDVMRAHASAASEPVDGAPGPETASGRPPVRWVRRDSTLGTGPDPAPPGDDRERDP